MKRNKLLKINKKGMGLIEVIAALGIATMVVTSLVSLAIFTLRSSLKSKLLLEGSKVANREMELIRAYRDKNLWSTFITNMNNCRTSDVPPKPVCYMDLDATSINLGIEPPVETMDLDQVSRGFYVEQDGDIIQVNVVVQWREGTDLKNTTLRTDLTNWQNK